MEKLCFLMARQLLVLLIARRTPVHLLGCFEREKLSYYYKLTYLISDFVRLSWCL